MIYKAYIDEPNKNKICIQPKYIKIKSLGDYRAWDDGTVAKSCEIYRYPPRLHYYDGDVYSLIYIFLKRLGVESIELKQLIMNLMFIAIWRMALMDIQVFYIFF